MIFSLVRFGPSTGYYNPDSSRPNAASFCTPRGHTPLGRLPGGTFISFLASHFLCCLFGKILVFAPRLPARESADTSSRRLNIIYLSRSPIPINCHGRGAGRKFPRSDPKLQTERRTERGLRGGLPAAIRVRLAARHIINLNHVSCSL